MHLPIISVIEDRESARFTRQGDPRVDSGLYHIFSDDRLIESVRGAKAANQRAAEIAATNRRNRG